MKRATDSLGSKTRYSIRRIFLLRKESYSALDAARTLCITPTELRARLPHLAKTGRVSRTEMMQLAVSRWPLAKIYEALGKDADTVLPNLLRTTEISFDLPEYQVEALRLLADRANVLPQTLLTSLLTELIARHPRDLPERITQSNDILRISLRARLAR
jgi:predicted ArsR family transcriptional regulator